MSARDELAELIGSKLDRLFNTREFGPASQDFDLADVILAAGYSKPRTITTVDELDELPDLSIVKDNDGWACQRNGYSRGNVSGYVAFWDSEGSQIGTDRIALPATVLYAPKES